VWQKLDRLAGVHCERFEVLEEGPTIAVTSTTSDPDIINKIVDIKWDWIDANPGRHLHVRIQYI
jgi:hypothetical protein